MSNKIHVLAILGNNKFNYKTLLQLAMGSLWMNRWSMLESEQRLFATYEYLEQLLETYERLGPMIGVFLPFIEAFLPFLPLIVFVFVNIATYGLFQGFFYSWLGSSLGSIAVFYIIRNLGRNKFIRNIRTNKQVLKVTSWVDRHGFGPLFLLLCFPFSPSSIINVVAGLSNISIQGFILAVLLGKLVMIFSLAYVGASILAFAKHPFRAIAVGLGIGLFWLIGKHIEKKLSS